MSVPRDWFPTNRENITMGRDWQSVIQSKASRGVFLLLLRRNSTTE
ncbi:MAG: hypothetical protein LBT09_03025 [Planctomycetaceae bacterium]|nr:hypothetical protein [Planctomycetaceae bacterium]